MKKNQAWLVLILSAVLSSAEAGTINQGIWSPVNCGEKPVAPLIPDSDVKAFNAAMNQINDWQTKVKVYFECLVKEANADNTIVAESANRQQAEHQKLVESLNQQIDAAEKKLSKK
jgi:hypothetical protein